MVSLPQYPWAVINSKAVIARLARAGALGRAIQYAETTVIEL
jgi:hypothetical protein